MTICQNAVEKIFTSLHIYDIIYLQFENKLLETDLIMTEITSSFQAMLVLLVSEA